MGALHDGHLSLMKEAILNNDVVVASVFVNPTQFNEEDDLAKYPRQLERDAELMEELGVDHIFAPTNGMMYSKNHVTFVEPTTFDEIPEGISRPGHFRGVATVVTKLFNIVQPTRAYFGQKDAAQCALIRRIVEDLNMPVDVQIMDTLREPDGLAMSSRNANLTQEERSASSIIYTALATARNQYNIALKSMQNGGTFISSKSLCETVERVLQTEPLLKEIYYVSVDDNETMRPISEVDSSGAVISLACRVGSVRLLDNIVL
eukprot:CAMPEP_0195529662 /NCGR_PEP_ID=MMETSP0794_2-20130614/32283_1 /TAXON_ID=515487 /ORGANISM="Stephanopyxis turris, Strain CCMP 815" /LENGTH=261 /DNA_ID=CAMNT_0040661011 /DNA_START=312 /DNA_END=1097 /DNA_ORIENTATION=+